MVGGGLYRSQGGRRKFRVRNSARSRRADRGRGLGRGASGGARNMEPRSAPSTSPPVALAVPPKNREVASLWLALPLSSSDFLTGRATAMKRETRLGSNAAVIPCAKRDTAVAALGTRLAICLRSRPGSDCKKREPVSVRGHRAPVHRAHEPKPRYDDAHIRVQARLLFRRRRSGASGLWRVHPASQRALAPAA